MHHLDEQRKTSYNAIAAAYDRFRPGYPPALVALLTDKYGLSRSSRVLEIGCGTGKFTRMLADVNCRVDALDISPKMLALAREQSGFGNVTFYRQRFEEYEAPAGCYDFILAATAFHWVSPEAREGRVAHLLKPGGTLAFFYNHCPPDAVRLEIDDVYRTVLGLGREDVPMADDASDRIFTALAQSPFFTDGRQYALPNPVRYDTASYLGKMGTHSFQSTLDEAQKRALFEGIERVIERHGGSVVVPYEVRLFCLRRV